VRGGATVQSSWQFNVQTEWQIHFEPGAFARHGLFMMPKCDNERPHVGDRVTPATSSDLEESALIAVDPNWTRVNVLPLQTP